MGLATIVTVIFSHIKMNMGHSAYCEDIVFIIYNGGGA